MPNNINKINSYRLNLSFILPVGLWHSQPESIIVKMSLVMLGMMNVCNTRQHKYHDCCSIPNSYYINYPMRMRRGKVIGLSVRLSVCCHNENHQITTSRHLNNS